jgi:hypothetical protein
VAAVDEVVEAQPVTAVPALEAVVLHARQAAAVLEAGPADQDGSATSVVCLMTRLIARRIVSAIFPLSGAIVAARAARSRRALLPAPASEAAAGWELGSKGTPPGGQQCESWHEQDQCRPFSTRSMSCSVMSAPCSSATSDP